MSINDTTVIIWLYVITVTCTGVGLIALNILIVLKLMWHIEQGRRCLAHATRRRRWVVPADAGPPGICSAGSTMFGAE